MDRSRAGERLFSALSSETAARRPIPDLGRRAGAVRHVVMVARPARSGPAAGLYFKRKWCAVADAAPVELDVVQYWDLA
jgi:hypothetical protein